MIRRRSLFHCSLYLFPLLPMLFPICPAYADDPSSKSAIQPIHPGDLKSLDQLQKDFSLFPYNQGIKHELITAYETLGRQQLKEKLFDEAAANFDHARELLPERLDFTALRGIALYLGKHFDEAAYELESARHDGGENAVVLSYLGLVRYDTGNLVEALDFWEKALELDPGNKSIRELAEKVRRELPVESGMQKGYRSVFDISYDEGSSSGIADEVLKVLETAYNRVGSDFSLYPSVRVPVILYTKKDYRSVTAGPEWSGGVFDGKVRLPIGGMTEMTPMLRGVLAHEYTHVVIRELTRGNCPSWLNEGLAEVEGRREYDPPLETLQAAAKAGALLPFASLEKSLSSLNTRDALLAYQQSYSMVKFLISSYGWHKVLEILASLGKGTAVEAAMGEVFADYSLDYKGLLQEWQTQIAKEYASK